MPEAITRWELPGAEMVRAAAPARASPEHEVLADGLTRRVFRGCRSHRCHLIEDVLRDGAKLGGAPGFAPLLALSLSLAFALLALALPIGGPILPGWLGLGGPVGLLLTELLRCLCLTSPLRRGGLLDDFTCPE